LTTQVEVRVEVRPAWPFRLGGGSMDGLLRRRGAALQRLLRVDGEPVLVGIVQPERRRVLFAARAATEAGAGAGIERMRFATGIDDDLRPFYDRFRDDPVIGRSVRTDLDLRVRRQPDPWQTLLAAITEQLIELERATAIQRRLIAAFGYRCPQTGMRDVPGPDVIARQAPARFVAFDLAPKRALAMRRCAEAVAFGRLDLRGHDLRRLLAIRDIGPWTAEMVGLHGQGRMDVVPAGDLGFLKIVGRLSTGNPRARADEAEVRGFFERYGEWKGMAGAHLMHAAARGLIPTRWSPGPALRPAGTRWSAAPARPARAA
jgi:3-methyladenine DNA glycosylase/8-oxoguanine DNA glycosylase